MKIRALSGLTVAIVALGALFIRGASLAGSTKSTPTCTASGCTCPTEQADGPLIIVLAPGAGTTVADATTTLAHSPKALATALHLHGTPTVELDTYDPHGVLTHHGTFPLAGQGTSPKRKDADAAVQAECLSHAAAALPAPAANGDLVRALNKAYAKIEGPGSHGGAVIAIGLGTSSIEQITLTRVDLTSADARTAVVATLTHDGLLPHSSVTTLLLAPDADVDNGIVASDVTSFAKDQLCPAVSSSCTAPAVLP